MLENASKRGCRSTSNRASNNTSSAKRIAESVKLPSMMTSRTWAHSRPLTASAKKIKNSSGPSGLSISKYAAFTRVLHNKKRWRTASRTPSRPFHICVQGHDAFDVSRGNTELVHAEKRFEPLLSRSKRAVLSNFGEGDRLQTDKKPNVNGFCGKHGV